MNIAKIPLPKGASSNSPKRIVIHAMGEFIKYKEEDMYAPYFLKEIGLSAHALITPEGTVIRCREDNQGGYHAKGHNTDTLGVEFMLQGVHDYGSFIRGIKNPWVNAKAYAAGQELIKQWMAKHAIKKEDVVYHSEIDPERKEDPGIGFPPSFRDTL